MLSANRSSPSSPSSKWICEVGKFGNKEPDLDEPFWTSATALQRGLSLDDLRWTIVLACWQSQAFELQILLPSASICFLYFCSKSKFYVDMRHRSMRHCETVSLNNIDDSRRTSSRWMPVTAFCSIREHGMELQMDLDLSDNWFGMFSATDTVKAARNTGWATHTESCRSMSCLHVLMHRFTMLQLTVAKKRVRSS